MDKISKCVVPKEKADYEYLFGECDVFDERWGVRMTIFIGYFDEVY